MGNSQTCGQGLVLHQQIQNEWKKYMINLRHSDGHGSKIILKEGLLRKESRGTFIGKALKCEFIIPYKAMRMIGDRRCYRKNHYRGVGAVQKFTLLMDKIIT